MKRSIVMLMVALATPVLVVPATAAAATADDEFIDSAFVKFTVKDGDTEVTHPGFDAYHGEDTILEIRMGDIEYEFKIFVDRKDDKSPYEVEVSLKRNGKEIIKGSKQKIAPKNKVEISAGKLSVEFSLDPHGALDKSRKKKIDGPDGDAPLD